MLRMFIDNEEVLSKNDFTIKEEMLNPSSTILNNVYPKLWEETHDYISAFYYPKDYSKLRIEDFEVVLPASTGETIQGTNLQITYDDRREFNYSLLGDTPSSPIPIQTTTGRQEVEVCGKNLFTSVWEQGEVSNTGVNVSSNNVIRTKDYIPVIPNQHYAANRTITTSYINVRCYDINKNYLGTGTNYINLISGSSAGNPMNVNVSECVISPKENVYYLRFNDYSNNLSTNYMMVKGDTQATYEPYKGQSYEVNLGKNLCGGFNYDRNHYDVQFNTYEDGTIKAKGTATNNAFSLGQTAARTILRINALNENLKRNFKTLPLSDHT